MQAVTVEKAVGDKTKLLDNIDNDGNANLNVVQEKYQKRSRNKLIIIFISIFLLIALIATVTSMVVLSNNSNANSKNNDKNDKNEVGVHSQQQSESVVRDTLTHNQLRGITSAPNSPVDYSNMALPSDAEQATQQFSGTFTITNMNSQRSISIIDDWYGYASNQVRRNLPPISADLVQNGFDLIPVIRYNQRTSHEYWEYILSSGKVWHETADLGWMRASIPFTLTQKNAQCAHNGVFMFLFNNDFGGNAIISNVWYQITSETCLYYKVDMWGLLGGSYDFTQTVSESAESAIAGFEKEVRNRIPSKPISELSSDYPGIDYTKFGADGLTKAEITAFGMYYDGVHYVGDTPTRSGTHPHPSSLIMPSYSTGKSVFIGYAAMYLQQKYGGNYFDSVIDIGSSSSKWSSVTVDDCIDMATGNYRFTTYMTDEGLLDVENQFFLPETHSAKYSHSVNYYNNRVSAGNRFVYHSSDHYLCGFAFKRYLRSQEGNNNADIHDEMFDNVYEPIGCSDALKQTKRTYDSEYQPFGSHGLFYTRDDMVKLGNLLNVDRGVINGNRVMDLGQVNAALQLDSSDRGLDISGNDDAQGNPMKYNNGFWSSQKLLSEIGCDTEIPWMRGYGGITVNLFPNGGMYYYFNDANQKEWLDAAIEMNKLSSFC